MDALVKILPQQLGSFLVHQSPPYYQVIMRLFRAFDTLSMLFEALEGDPKSELFQKIEFYRKTLTISQARLWVS